MVRRIAHIGIAVNDLQTSIDLISKLFGSSLSRLEHVEDQNVSTAMFSVGGTSIELLKSTSPESPVAKFIEKRGEGVHHIAVYVDNIVDELERLKNEGFVLVDETPRKGADNCLVAFLHPKSTNGVLIEISQKLE